MIGQMTHMSGHTKKRQKRLKCHSLVHLTVQACLPIHCIYTRQGAERKRGLTDLLCKGLPFTFSYVVYHFLPRCVIGVRAANIDPIVCLQFT